MQAAVSTASPSPTSSPTPTVEPTATPAGGTTVAVLPTPASNSTATPVRGSDHAPLPTVRETYLHPTGLWQINFPDGWNITGPTWSQSLPIENVKFQHPDDFARMTVGRFAGLESVDLESWSNSILASWREIYPSMQMVSRVSASIGGYPAYEVVFIYTFQSFDFFRIGLHVISGEDGYIIAGETTQSWDEAQEMLAELVHSFQVAGAQSG